MQFESVVNRVTDSYAQVLSPFVVLNLNIMQVFRNQEF